MKKIFFPLFVLAIAACGGNKNNNSNTTSPDQETEVVTESVKDTVKTDAISSATSKPNEALFNGTLVLSPEGQISITVIMGGTVKSTNLLSGKAVHKGQVLVTLENPTFIDLQQTYLDSRAQLEYLEAEYKRQSALSQEQAASQKKVQQSKADYLSMKSKEQASAAQLQLLGVDASGLEQTGIRPYLEIKSPIDGYIGNLQINPGKHIAAGETICEVINKNKILLKLIAYEKDLNSLNVGDPIEFMVNGTGSEIFRATLISIGQQVDNISRSLELYAKIEANKGLFRPGMYVSARILHNDNKPK